MTLQDRPPLPPRLSSGRVLRLTNARIVQPDTVVTGTLTVEGGTIADITPGAPSGLPAAETLECGGAILIPGLIELHTDNLERHLEPRPEVDWPHMPALLAHDGELAAAGITTVFDALRVGVIRSPDGSARTYARALAREIVAARAAGSLKISHYMHLRAESCSHTVLDELAEFTPDDRIGIVSLMDHTPGERQLRDLRSLRAYYRKRRGMTDPEFDAHLTRTLALSAEVQEANAAGIVREAGRIGAVLASHDDTIASHVAASRAQGVTFAEFPTSVEAAEACHAAGIAIMMGAPNLIRGGSHSGNVAAADLAARDLLDIVSSDYVPSALILAAFRLAAIWGDLPRAIRTVTRTPAAVTGLTDRGALLPGHRADLACVAMLGDTPVLRGVWSAGHRVA